MEINNYEVTIKKGKDEQEVSIEIDMEEYGESFAVNAYHLGQQYGASVINPVINEDKINFLEDQIKKKEGDDVHIGKRELKRLMKEVDADYKSYQEEIASYTSNDED